MEGEFKETSAETYRVNIYVAGDVGLARNILQEYAMRGACVSVAACDYVYTGGMESGVNVGLINYPRLPSSKPEILKQAIELAKLLIEGLFQGSATVVADDKSIFISRRGDL